MLSFLHYWAGIFGRQLRRIRTGILDEYSVSFSVLNWLFGDPIVLKPIVEVKFTIKISLHTLSILSWTCLQFILNKHIRSKDLMTPDIGEGTQWFSFVFFLILIVEINLRWRYYIYCCNYCLYYYWQKGCTVSKQICNLIFCFTPYIIQHPARFPDLLLNCLCIFGVGSFNLLSFG